MKKTIIYSLLFAAASLVSCAEYLDTEPEGGTASDEQLEEMLKKDPESVIIPMVEGAVSYLHDGTYYDDTESIGFKSWMMGFDMSSNDMVNVYPSNWFASDYVFPNNAPRRATGKRAAQNWYCFYKIVFFSNQILDRLAKVEPAAYTNNLVVAEAQALTYRALAYYYLLSIYRDDYMTGGKDKPGLPFYRAVGPEQGCEDVTKMYIDLIGDLQKAVTLFEQAGHDPYASTTDIDATVANMVLARVALNAGKYDIAAAAAEEVVDSYILLPAEEFYDGTTVFASLEGNPEAIWGYKWHVQSSVENDAFLSNMALYAVGYGGLYGNGYYVAIDQRLYDRIPDTDVRKQLFLPEGAAAGKEDLSYCNVKFTSPDEDTGYYGDDIYMRVAEAFLLKAEAEARAGNDEDAQMTLFDLVSARDETYEQTTATGAELLDEIWLQSRIELWGEGHEFFTNKRFGKTTNRREGVGEGGAGTNHGALVVLEKKQMTFQIPLSLELTHNKHMTDADQNPL